MKEDKQRDRLAVIYFVLLDLRDKKERSAFNFFGSIYSFLFFLLFSRDPFDNRK